MDKKWEREQERETLTFRAPMAVSMTKMTNKQVIIHESLAMSIAISSNLAATKDLVIELRWIQCAPDMLFILELEYIACCVFGYWI